MESRVITKSFMDVQEGSQEQIGKQMSMVRDAKTGDDRAKATILLEAANKAQEALLNGLAAVDTRRDWNGLAARNAAMIERFLEGLDDATKETHSH